MPPSTDRKLRIQFQKTLQKGYVQNACLDPCVPAAVGLVTESNETVIVRVDPKQGGHYWFSDRRVLRQDSSGVRELLRYEAVRRARLMNPAAAYIAVPWLLWMLGNLSLRDLSLQEAKSRRQYHGWLKIEVTDSVIVLEGLEQA